MDEQVFGAPAGQLNDLAAQGLKNDYNNLPNTDIEAGMVSDRVLPRQVGTGVTRGTWRINNTDGSYITIGEIPDSGGEFGVAYFNADGVIISKNLGTTQYQYNTDGELVFKNTGETLFIYDVVNNKNIIQMGLLPDGTYGMVVAKVGIDVSEVFA